MNTLFQNTYNDAGQYIKAKNLEAIKIFLITSR